MPDLWLFFFSKVLCLIRLCYMKPCSVRLNCTGPPDIPLAFLVRFFPVEVCGAPPTIVEIVYVDLVIFDIHRVRHVAAHFGRLFEDARLSYVGGHR